MTNLSILAQPPLPTLPPQSKSSGSLYPFSNVSHSELSSQTDKQGYINTKNRCFWNQDKITYYTAMSSNRCRLKKLHSVFPPTPAVASAVEDLFDFMCKGPLLPKMGLTPDMVESSIDKWLTCSQHLCRLFGLNELYLTIPEKIRIYHYYIPVFLWCDEQIAQHQSSYKDGDEIPPLMIGVSAPQGSGKTTLVFGLDYLFRVTGRNSASISIDDFYLTAEDQARLRSENQGNALLELRGNAGSHDLQLSIETLTALGKLTKEGMKMKLPRYDKSAYSGRGDRADPSTWPEVEGPLSVVLFEGWMLGFKPLPIETIKAVNPQLEVVNINLEAYYNAWDKFVDSWLIIKINDPSCVFNWRLQAEKAMIADGKSGMSDEEVMDFVSRYMPAYKAYLPTMASGGDEKHEAKIIDGKAIAQTIREEIAAEVLQLSQKYGKVPGLAVVIVGTRKDSQSYVSMKRKACCEVGIKSFDVDLPEGVTEEELVKKVHELNENPDVHGILVQLPLPKHINEERVLTEISIEKDVDGFHPLNIGKLAMKGRDPLFLPCTPKGCLELLKRSGISVRGKKAVVVGRSNIVGLPVSLLLLKADATVTVVHSHTRDAENIIREADIVIAAAGQAMMIKGDWIKPGAAVIDVGTNAVDDPSRKSGYRLVGDVDFKEASKVAGYLTPVPGGVGPMTVAMLLRNTLDGAKQMISQ